MLYTIEFGRTVGTGPDQLSDKYWAAFRLAVRRAVDAILSEVTVLFDGTGPGVYEGVAEESACIVFACDQLDALQLKWLRWKLAQAAYTFRQEAIALSCGTTGLVASCLHPYDHDPAGDDHIGSADREVGIYEH